ncbi:MAG: molybdopterin converting factor small subunit [Pirellulaceae bacterium]|jgi:molybdopterin converting factor small subunit
MKIQLKLMGMLKDQTPPSGALELNADATITDALIALEVPVESIHVFMVNGTLERDKARVLADGDELTVLPPVGGG